MRRNALFFLFVLPSLLAAQADFYRPILDDPDVVWAAEIRPIFNLEPAFNITPYTPVKRDSGRNEAVPLKLLNDDGFGTNLGDILLSEKLLDLCLDGDVKAFSDDGGATVFFDKKARHALLFRIDTAVTFNLETYEEKVLLVENGPNPDEIYSVKVRQLLFYRASTGDFELYTAAFAPMLDRIDGNGNFRYSMTPFWFKLPPYSKIENASRPSLADPNIRWAYRMKTGTNSPRVDSAATWKDFYPPVMGQLLKRFRTDAKWEVFGPDFEPIPFRKRADFETRADTVVTFDPESYEEKIIVVKTVLEPADFSHLKLIEDWFWDERRHEFIIRLRGFGPMRDWKNGDGSFRYRTVAFWRLKK